MHKATTLLTAAAAIFIAVSHPASAESVGDGYNQARKSTLPPAPLGPALFGDQTSLLDGQTEFEITDIALATNGAIPISFGRRLRPNALNSDRSGSTTTARPIFGQYWDPLIPYLSGTFDARVGWVGSDGRQAKRCSAFGFGPPVAVGLGPFSNIPYQTGDFFDGIQISIPGHGSETLYGLTAGQHRPADGKSYFMTTRNDWRVSCVPSVKNTGLYISGEGYSVVLPDGSRYTFDWMVSKPTTHIMDATCRSLSYARSATLDRYGVKVLNYCTSGVAVPRSEIYLFATEARDRFGNRVVYTFDPGMPEQLSSIKSFGANGVLENQITFTYHQGRVETATSGGRTWRYNYDGSQRLSEVIQPDLKKWTYAYDGAWGVNFYDVKRIWADCRVQVGTKTTSVAPGLSETSSLTVTGPSGATGKFEFRDLLFGTREGESSCYISEVWGGVGPSYPELIVPYQPAYQIRSLYRKTLSGPGLAPSTWTLGYSPSWVAPYRSETVIQDPLGVAQRLTFGNAVSFSPTLVPVGNFGLLLESAVEQGGQLKRRDTYTYSLDSTGQLYPTYIGQAFATGAGPLGSMLQHTNRPLVRRDIAQDGGTFTWRVAKDCGSSGTAYCFDGFVRPTRIVRSSAP